ncbi:uncharacterized protein TNCT_132091 [Trichonephila clavata]|uniref:Uncharacterized protein n=1 Tax=Trichonephila clavata TaxID=2740835 RepID=A0A8X6JN36_TRICU|nr:uncharacterized protein TNCT_132091 [Trichonephila clavata]
MPKNPWNYRKRKRSKKNKSKESDTASTTADRISEENVFKNQSEEETEWEDFTSPTSTTLLRASSKKRNNPVTKKIKIEPSDSVVPETVPEINTDETPNKNIKEELPVEKIPPNIQKNTGNESSENTEKVLDECSVVEKPMPVIEVAKKIKIEPSDSIVPETVPEINTEETPNKNIKEELLVEKIPPNIQKNTDNESSENTEKVLDECTVVEKPKQVIKFEVIDLTDETTDAASMCTETINSADKLSNFEKSCDKVNTVCQYTATVHVKTEQDIVSANLELPSIVSSNDSNEDPAWKNSNVCEKSCNKVNTVCQSDIICVKTKQNIASASHELSSSVSSRNDSSEDPVWKNSIFSVERSISRVNSTAGNPPYDDKAPFSAPLLSYVKKHTLLEEISKLKLLLNKIVDKQKKNENLLENPETERRDTSEYSYFLERVESPVFNFEEESLDEEKIEYLTLGKSTPNKSLDLNDLSSNSSRMLGTRKSDSNSFSSLEPDSKKARYSLDLNLSNASQNIENTSSTSSDKVDLNPASRFDSSMEIGDLSVEYYLGSENCSLVEKKLSFAGAPKIDEQPNFSKLELLNIINNVKETNSSNNKSGIVSLNGDRGHGFSSVNIKSSVDGKSKYGAAISQNTLSNETSVNRNNKKVLAASPQDGRYENPLKRKKQLEETVDSSSKIKKLNMKEYWKKIQKRESSRDPRVKASPLAPVVSSAHYISNNSPTDSSFGSYSPSVAYESMHTPLNTFSNDGIQSFSPTLSGNWDFPMQDTNANPTFEANTIQCDLNIPNSVAATTSNDPSQNFPSVSSLISGNTGYLQSILNSAYDHPTTENTGIPGITDTLSTFHSTLSTPLSSSYFLQNQDSRQSNQQFSNSKRHENKVTNRKALLPTPHFLDNTMPFNSHSQVSSSLIDVPLEDKTGRVIDPHISSFISSFPNVHLTRIDDYTSDTSSMKLPSTPESSASNSSSDTPKRIPDLNFENLLPYNLKKDIGVRYICTNDVYLIIIEWNIDTILSSHDKAISFIKFSHVRNVYDNALQYYNTYFPLLLQECWNRLYVSLKKQYKKERFDFLCKINNYEPKKNYVSVSCDCVFPSSNGDNIPKDGNIILVQFASRLTGSIKMLGYVYYSATRQYSHRHDRDHETVRFVTIDEREKLMKMKFSFYIVFNDSSINDQELIQIMRLTNIKKVLMQNDALRGLSKSCLRDSILNPLHHSVRMINLPKRPDSVDFDTVIKDMFWSLKRDIPQLVLLKASDNTDTYLTVMQLLDVILKTDKSGKTLLCVKQDFINTMGQILLQSFKNVIIINREKEKLSEELYSRVFDVMVSNLQHDGYLDENSAKSQVFKESNVILAATNACFYEDIHCLSKDLNNCIVHEAHIFPEPEAILPLKYRVRHLYLIGNPGEKCATVHSKAAIGYGYDKSLFNRIYNMT